MEDEEPIDSKQINILSFSPQVQDAINMVIPSFNSLDKHDFDVISYVNEVFPTEQSLSNIDDVILDVKSKIRNLDDEIAEVIRGQINVGEDGHRTLDIAQKTISQLFLQIKDIKEKAEKSENMVKEITRDIKQLDNAKRNLTTSITTLNNLHMLISGVNSLETLLKRKQYGEVANLLEGVCKVFEQYQSYKEIPEISTLNDKISEIKIAAAQQIRTDFEDAFQGSKPGPIDKALLGEACYVINVLDVKVKKDLIRWFVNLHLSEYSQLFTENEECSWLDKIDQRFNWIKKTLLNFEEKFGKMFPQSWDVSEHICVDFCHITRNDLSKLMARRVREIEVKLLLFAIHRTTNFEDSCAAKFSGRTILNPHPINGEIKEKHLSPFIGIISKCFETHLNIYIESQDRSLSDMIEKFNEQIQDQLKENNKIENTNALNSCGDLFMYYKKCMVQCFQLSTGPPLLLLVEKFQKYLREYANKILIGNLPKISHQESISNSLARFSRQEPSIALASNLLSSILKETDFVKLTEDEQRRTCAILSTAEYCMETTQQLENKLKEKIDPDLIGKVDLKNEMDMFHNVISSAIMLLVQDLENACEPALIVMTKLPWQSMDAVGDQSSYINSIIQHLKSNIIIIGTSLELSRKFYTQFCIKFATLFIQKYVSSLMKCKSISTVGAEQLLLDTHSLKAILQELPAIGLKIERQAPASFTRIVLKGMSRAEMILKVVMSPFEPINAFIDNYLKLLPEGDFNEFQKIVEMKGIRRQDQLLAFDLFQNLKPSPVKNSPTQDSKQAQSDSLAAPVVNHPPNEFSRIKKLEKLIKKRL